MTLNPRVKANVQLKARLIVLHDVVHELFHAFGAKEKTPGILRNGIVENQVIRQIILRYLNDAGQQVARITIEIDWDKHRVLAQTADGEKIAVSEDSSLSIAEQIHSFLPEIVQHTNALRQHYHVKKVEPSYKCLDDIERHPKRLREAYQLLGLTLKGYEWADEEPGPDDDELQQFLKFSPDKLEELSIKIEQRPRENG